MRNFFYVLQYAVNSGGLINQKPLMPRAYYLILCSFKYENRSSYSAKRRIPGWGWYKNGHFLRALYQVPEGKIWAHKRCKGKIHALYHQKILIKARPVAAVYKYSPAWQCRRINTTAESSAFPLDRWRKWYPYCAKHALSFPDFSCLRWL